MKQWKTLKKTTILDFNKYLCVEQHTIELPDGNIIHDWPWIISPDYALVLPVTEKYSILLFQQVKYAIEGTSLAPIGGYLEPGEDPLGAAKRELREEMGCDAREWVSLGSFPVNGNHGGGKAHLFIALDVYKAAKPVKDDLEEMNLVELTIEEVEQKLFQGEIKVQGWVAVIAMGLLYLKKIQHSPYFRNKL
jgi:ADP-ribose pyrophosphatase